MNLMSRVMDNRDESAWNELAKQDVNCSSVIDPNDTTGLKVEYANIIHKKCILKD